MFEATLWAFVPALVAIALALVTKQVYPSLFAGIFVGALLYSEGNPMNTFSNIIMLMGEKLGENGGILVFLVVLGVFAVLLSTTGATRAYGEWAADRIVTKRGSLLATIALGCLIFVDDYFNCLTVGSVMRPVTDKHNISRAKLAYIIDSTAAPVCIIAPISSWAAAVSGFLDGENAIITFIMTIPFNLYALLTLVMMVCVALLGFDFGKMKKNEQAAEAGDLFAGEYDLPSEDVKTDVKEGGKVWMLIAPIVILIVCCIGSMIYNGYFYNWGSSYEASFSTSDVISYHSDESKSVIVLENSDEVIAALEESGAEAAAAEDGLVYYYTFADNGNIELYIDRAVTFSATTAKIDIYAEIEPSGMTSEPQSSNVIEAFSNCDAGLSLGVGSVIALIITFILLIAAKALSFKECMGSLTSGFKSMVPAILILIFAWTLSGVMGAKGGYLDARGFVETNMTALTESGLATVLIPAIFFLAACFISFATGTSWGTFGILIPVATSILGTSLEPSVILAISAILAGAVYGDHVSPISDTTIMASSGAGCNHVDHVKTQLPYATLCAGISFVAYIIAGLIVNTGIGYGWAAVSTLGTGLVLLAAVFLGIWLYQRKKGASLDK